MELIVSLGALAVLAGVGAGRAVVKSGSAETAGRRAELSILAVLLVLTAMACLAGAWWVWSFMVEFTF